jgi:hypothetical protein
MDRDFEFLELGPSPTFGCPLDGETEEQAPAQVPTPAPDSDPILLPKTTATLPALPAILDRYGIAILYREDASWQTVVANTVATYAADYIFADSTYGEMMPVVCDFARGSPMTTLFVTNVPADGKGIFWDHIATGWPLNLKVVVIVDEDTEIPLE